MKLFVFWVWKVVFETYQEGSPDYWGIETSFASAPVPNTSSNNQEGSPDYWGIETLYALPAGVATPLLAHQEGSPDYWGIETLAFTRRSRFKFSPEHF